MVYIKQSIKRFVKFDGLDAAAVLSFSTIFATVPILALAFGVFSFSPYFNHFQFYLEQFLFEQLASSSYDIALTYLRQFIYNAKNISGFNILFLLIAAILLFYNIDTKINAMYGSHKRRNISKGLFMYLLTIFFGPLLLSLSLFLSSYIFGQDVFIIIPVKGLIVSLLPIIISGFGLTIIYYVIPIKSPKLSIALKSGFIAALLLEIVKSLMLIYVNYLAIYHIIYGTFAMILLFILWVYFNWIIILLGVSYAKVLENNNV